MQRPLALLPCLSYLCLMALGHQAFAQSATLPEQARSRILKSASETLRDGGITKTQFKDLVRWVNAAPCRSVSMRATSERLQAIAAAVSKTQGFPNSRVIAYYEFKGWYFIYTDASPGDETYLLYREDPAQEIKSVLGLSGAFTMYETTEVRDSVVRDAPGIPRALADCISWQVTLGQ